MITRLLRYAFVTALVVAAGMLLAACWGQSLTASVAKPKAGYVRLNEPVQLDFNQKVDPASIKVGVSPSTEVKLVAKGKTVLVTATTGWKPNQTYSIKVTNAKSSDHSLSLSNWKGSFQTQPVVGIAGYLVDGKPVPPAANPPPVIDPISTVTMTFTAAMKEDTVTPTLGGQAVPAARLKWADDAKSLAISGPFAPYTNPQIGVSGKPVTQKGDVASDLPAFSATVRGLEPSNASSGITPGYQTQAALLVVIDNAGLARPQAGLGQADMVFEYISEYSISRFTLVYFNQPAGTMGPVRSCRMINAYLLEEFHGIQMCSGGSVGTLHYLYGTPLLNTMINDFDNGNHFFRVDFKPAPHNLYTSSDRAIRLRSEQPIGGGNYAVDPPHPDNGLGDPGNNSPSVPLHGVGYQYDGSCSCYRPFDQGTPRVDTNLGGAQIGVKNVVVMHVPFRDAGWVEDENGGAHSIWYQMNGSGAAEIYSDGKLIQGQWHQGDPNQDYYQNTTQPVYFTDANGNFIRLNTGLTWVHVVGDGQNS